jgi:hypothetical protein
MLHIQNKPLLLAYWMFKGEIFGFLLHLPPLRFHCVGGCWERTQDCYDYGIDSQAL